MKKILLIVAFIATAFTGTAQAHGFNRGAYFTSGVVIGAATYAYATHYGPRNVYGPPVYYTNYPYYYPQPVVVQQPVYVQQPYPSSGYHQESILDANCNCYRTVLVPN